MSKELETPNNIKNVFRQNVSDMIREIKGLQKQINILLNRIESEIKESE